MAEPVRPGPDWVPSALFCVQTISRLCCLRHDGSNVVGMASTTRIDFISSYCDRWCERCAFRDRCSAFACEVAIGMCGDAAEGLELAIGAPHPVHEKPDEDRGRREFLELISGNPRRRR